MAPGAGIFLFPVFPFPSPNCWNLQLWIWWVVISFPKPSYSYRNHPNWFSGCLAIKGLQIRYPKQQVVAIELNPTLIRSGIGSTSSRFNLLSIMIIVVLNWPSSYVKRIQLNVSTQPFQTNPAGNIMHWTRSGTSVVDFLKIMPSRERDSYK